MQVSVFKLVHMKKADDSIVLPVNEICGPFGRVVQDMMITCYHFNSVYGPFSMFPMFIESSYSLLSPVN